jgi:hypothetical protein
MDAKANSDFKESKKASWMSALWWQRYSMHASIFQRSGVETASG